MPKPILNIADVELRKVGHGANALRSRNAPEKFQAQVGEIGRRIGAQKLGYNLTVVPPGTAPGRSTVIASTRRCSSSSKARARCGSARRRFRSARATSSRIRRAAPDTAHQIVNTSNAELKYLAISTMETPEICDYPDSGKFAVMNDASRVRTASRSSGASPRATGTGVDYCDGE